MHDSLTDQSEQNSSFEGAKALTEALASAPGIEAIPIQNETNLALERPLTAELAAVPEAMINRVEKAVEASDYEPTPEVREAIAGFYNDHYKLSMVLEGVVDNSIDAAAAGKTLTGAKLAETAAINGALHELLSLQASGAERDRVLRAAANITRDMLFQEQCVGVQTVGEEELSHVRSIVERISQQAVAEGLASVDDLGATRFYGSQHDGYLPNAEAEIREIEDASGRTRQDSRHAGQLLFHNSSTFNEIALSGYQLKSRTQQLLDGGTFNAQTEVTLTPGANMHSNVPHWSENYSYFDYKGSGDATRPGTLAVPLADIVGAAPYGRNREYGVVKYKADRVQAADTTPINDGLADIGFGGRDLAGASGGDRVFMADNRSSHAVDAVTYQIDGENGYQLFTRAEERIFYDYADGYGIGEHLPGKVVFDFDHHNHDPEHRGPWTAGDSLRKQHMLDGLAVQVRELQHASRERPEYQGKFVVPLREGVMEFVDEGNTNTYRAFDQYREAVAHSTVKAEVARAVISRQH